MEPLVPGWLSTLIFIFATILLIDSIGSFVLWKHTRNDMFFKAGVGWSANFINFVVHGAATKNDHITLIGHSFFYITACCLTMILCDSTGQKFSIKKFSLAGLLMLFSSLFTYAFTRNYFWSALILDLFISFPLFYFSFKALSAKGSEVVAKALAVFLILNGLHFLDYPFLYNHPSGSVAGFSLAFLLCIMVSILIPTLILQLISKKLTQRTRELEKGNHDNVTLLSIVCHDISTPVTIADFSLEKLLKHSNILNSDQNRSVLRIKQSLDAVTEILKKVRELHAGKLGKLNLSVQPIDIEPLISEVVQLFQVSCEQKSIQIQFLVKNSDKKIVFIDPVLFKHQILGNLISNAIKFSEPGTQIEIHLSKNENTINIEIIDQGRGIDVSRLRNLFNVNISTTSLGTDSEPGTGLGLPTVKMFTEKMGGQIAVCSSTGNENENRKQGTTFSLTFKSAG